MSERDTSFKAETILAAICLHYCNDINIDEDYFSDSLISLREGWYVDVNQEDGLIKIKLINGDQTV